MQFGALGSCEENKTDDQEGPQAVNKQGRHIQFIFGSEKAVELQGLLSHCGFFIQKLGTKGKLSFQLCDYQAILATIWKIE